MNSILTIILLIILEGFLSFDNALVLAATVRHLPIDQQKKALVYGIYGAFIFRALAVLGLTALMALPWIRFLGGAYLVYLSIKHFFFNSKGDSTTTKIQSAGRFWRTILTVELLDVAFSIDSIMTSVALSNIPWIIITGGLLGIVMMRCASFIFIKLMDKWPFLEHWAYVLIMFAGIKLFF